MRKTDVRDGDSSWGELYELEVDDRGRVTLPATVLEWAKIGPGDLITCRLVGSVVELDLESDTGFVTATAGRTDWSGTTPMDAGEGLFGLRNTERE